MRSVHSNTELNLLSVIEGTQESLKRFQLDYVDIIFAHHADHTGMPGHSCLIRLH